MIDANSQFFAILTNVGMAKQANADALGIPWLITQMGVGDANPTGLEIPPNPVPSAGQTKLINEWRRRPLNQLKIDPVNPAVIIAEQVIPADEGGKWIREIGLYDADGDLVAVANCAPSFKPLLSQGSGRTQIVRMNFIVTSTGNITLKIDPAIVLASRAYVDAAILEVLPKNKTPGEYTRVKVNDRGIVVSGDNPDTLAKMGIKDSYTKAEIEAMIAQASALPVGAMVAFPVDKVAPGFLELDGSVKSIAVYPDLAAFLGTVFNKGDEGAGNFRLPESRGEFLRGWDHGRGVDVGRVIGTLQEDMLKTHNHRYFDDVAATMDPAGGTLSAKVNGNQQTISTGAFVASGANSGDAWQMVNAMNTVNSGGVETRSRNLAVMWCIKAWNAPINQGDVDIAALAALVAEFSLNGPAVGTTRNGKMSVPTASASSTYTADELIVGDANGRTYRLRNFNQAINLALAVKGLGAMDVGGAPVSGYAAFYALFNPATKAQGMIAVNTSGSVAPELCAGVIPAGYTASALLAVHPTNGSGQLVEGSWSDREFTYSAGVQVLSTNAIIGATTALNVPGVLPRNAKTISGSLFVNTTATSAGQGYIFLYLYQSSAVACAAALGAVSNLFGTQSSFSRLPVTMQQALFYQTGGPVTPLFKISIQGFTI